MLNCYIVIYFENSFCVSVMEVTVLYRCNFLGFPVIFVNVNMEFF